MDRNILYLFNSASRPLYKDNLYKILALPVGAVTQFRYTTEHHVPPELISRPLKGVESLIVFIDRFSEGLYTYYPIRKGKLLEASKVGDRLFLKCRLGEYCGVDNTQRFTSAIKGAAKGIPELTDGDPENTKDGYYMQLGEKIKDELKTDVDCWLTSVKGISQTKGFRNEHTAFLRISLKNNSRGKSEIFHGHDGSAVLKAGKPYSFEILYYDPEKGEVDKSITFSLQEPLKSYGLEQFDLGALTERISIPFGAGKALSSVRTSINFIVKCRQSEIYRIVLPAEVSSRHLLWGTALYATFIFIIIIFEKFVFPFKN